VGDVTGRTEYSLLSDLNLAGLTRFLGCVIALVHPGHAGIPITSQVMGGAHMDQRRRGRRAGALAPSRSRPGGATIAAGGEPEAQQQRGRGDDGQAGTDPQAVAVGGAVVASAEGVSPDAWRATRLGPRPAVSRWQRQWLRGAQ
jgi:hypothetical protein